MTKYWISGFLKTTESIPQQNFAHLIAISSVSLAVTVNMLAKVGDKILWRYCNFEELK